MHLSTSIEPEVGFEAGSLLVPRLVSPYQVQAAALRICFAAVCKSLVMYTRHAATCLDMDRLLSAYSLLDILCGGYLQSAMCSLQPSKVQMWHHKLLCAWCTKQLSTSERAVAPADVREAHADLWAEVQLAERCGPHFAEALSGATAFQELLFPGASMDAVLPVYEDSVGAAFYNGCVVAAIEAILASSRGGRSCVAIEVGAGTGGTASSVLPVLQGECSQYVFTDVSELFLRLARARFASFAFFECALLNIDADPRLQGFAPHQCDIGIATNVLHATPFVRRTLQNCEQLLCTGGVLIVDEALTTSTFVQITFGMTDGWWLFAEGCDPERIGQNSPLLSWRQWQALLLDNGFPRVYCMQGDTFLRGQAVIVAQTASTNAPSTNAPVALDDGSHVISGGLGGLGLLTARLLVENGLRQIVLSSRSDRVVAGSEGDWAWLVECHAGVRRIRCDASEDGQVCAIAFELCGSGLLVRGVFHAAHGLADATLANQNALNFRTAFGPKVHGAVALHSVLWFAPLRFFNVYSSIAGLMGSAGQAPHSAANAWLDAMVRWRHARGVCGQGVNWGAVAEIGYAARAGADLRAEMSGFGAISRTAALSALNGTLLPACRSFVVLPVDWSKLSMGSMEPCGALTGYSNVDLRGGGRVNESCALSTAVGLDDVLEMMACVIGQAVDADTLLLDAGLDSLAAAEVRNQLQTAVGEAGTLPSTLVFDHPTARQLAISLQEFAAPSVSALEPVPHNQVGQLNRLASSAAADVESYTQQVAFASATDLLSCPPYSKGSCLVHVSSGGKSFRIDPSTLCGR
jgi:SAM-dependent methyltransferase